MFGQVKNKIAQWCRSQVKVLPTQLVKEQGDDEHLKENFNLIMMLPRHSYFETYKTYPLSVGRDITKIATVEGRQVSPYPGASWSGTLVIKQPEQYLVYYFVLLPKYQYLIEQSLPLFVIPETAHSLVQLTRGKSINEGSTDFQKNENGIWLSSLGSEVKETSPRLNFTLEQLSIPALQAFFNSKVLVKFKDKFSRWQQVKLLSISAVVASLYIGMTSLYLTAMDQYLTNKNDQARPIIGDLFKAKDALNLLQQQQQEFAQVYQTTEKTGPLLIIEQQLKEFTLLVKSIEVTDDVVRLNASASNANALLEKLLSSPEISQAEFKSDIKIVRGAREEFELEFVWAQPLWLQGQSSSEGKVNVN